MGSLPPVVLPPPGFSNQDFTISKLQANRPLDLEFDLEEEPDIYRGRTPPPELTPPSDGVSISSIAPSSTSSASLGVGRRLGALAAVVELAISRWARAGSSSSSTTTSSSSSSSGLSVSTTTRTNVTRRRRQHSSHAALQNIASERIIIARKKAREEFRIVSREFVLFLPTPLSPVPSTPFPSPSSTENDRRILRTPSLPLILAQLDSALKRSVKSRRFQQHTIHTSVPGVMSRDMDHCDTVTGSISQAKHTKARKGKHKEVAAVSKPLQEAIPVSLSSSGDGRQRKTQNAWWLDVASPTWEDMRALGRLLHLHPLTLEDILHQEPREKLEVFPKLGYYFVVFRAIEGQRSRQGFRQLDRGGDTSADPGDEGVIGAVNLYLVVFREGICSFHFEDISEHAERVRNKVLQFEENMNMSSVWIAHGIMDSVVDAFFPILSAIEREVEEVEKLVLSNGDNLDEMINADPTLVKVAVKSSRTETVEMQDRISEGSDATLPLAQGQEIEKVSDALWAGPRKPNKSSRRTQFAVRVTFSFRLRRLRRYVRSLCSRWISRRRSLKGQEALNLKPKARTTTAKTLLRMTETRRLVTSLGRLLASKSEVVGQIRKRLFSGAVWQEAMGDSGEVAIHFGDVQDHIVTLQQSLVHYERMLSHSHPAYLSQLRVSLAQAKGGTDKALFILTLVSLTVICIQTLVGLFSINVGRLPRNGLQGHLYTVFGVVIVLALLVAFAFLSLVRWWWLQARKKYGRNLKL